MNASILNREFKHPADGWYHIEPAGEHPNREAGVVQVIDGEARESIVNRFNAGANAGTLSHGNEMLIDHEHFSHEADKETRAYGWLTRLDNRADGLYGQVRWTGTGKAAVDNGDYRYFSTEYSPDDLQVLPENSKFEIRNSKIQRVRPMALAGLTLTNRPNNRGGKPITNSLREQPSDSTAGAQADKPHKNTMKLTASKLGLSADASEEGILGEIDKLMNRATLANDIVTERDTLKKRVTELETTNTALDGELCDSLMDAHGIKSDDKIRNRLRPVLAGLKNRQERIDTLTEFGFKPGGQTGPTSQTSQTRLTNRGATAKNLTEQTGEAGVPDGKQAQIIMNRAQTIVKEIPGMSLASAVGMAKREVEAA